MGTRRAETDQASRLRAIMMQTHEHDGDSMRPMILTVTSGKGGVGKSTFALNLALKLCDEKRHVLLFDADANLANLDVLMGISPEYRLGNVLRGEVTMEEALVSPYPRLRILPGSSGDRYYPEMNGTIQQSILDKLSSINGELDLIIVDTSAGLNQEIVAYALRSDLAVVVTNSEPTSIMDAYAMIKILLISRPELRISIVVNAAKSQSEADTTAHNLQRAVTHFLKHSVDYLGYIPYDEKVRLAVRHQSALVHTYPRSPASISIQGIAQKIARENTTTVTERSMSIV